jgi:hypothetical protein
VETHSRDLTDLLASRVGLTAASWGSRSRGGVTLGDRDCERADSGETTYSRLATKLDSGSATRQRSRTAPRAARTPTSEGARSCVSRYAHQLG